MAARPVVRVLVNTNGLAISRDDALLDLLARHRERVEAALGGQSAYVLVDDLEQGLVVVDEWAAEHLEVVTRDAPTWAGRVTNAGAVFVGPFSPVSLGDYLAGSNHVLPTGGTARHTGGLSVQSFLRSQHVVEYDRAALAAAVLFTAPSRFTSSKPTPSTNSVTSTRRVDSATGRCGPRATPRARSRPGCRE